MCQRYYLGAVKTEIRRHGACIHTPLFLQTDTGSGFACQRIFNA
ncbi:hypothetical protein EKO26_05260 [Citrobacter portucalensis]|nr:hypothetical protein EKO26_05260 [Citrobacter portucalensis]